MFQLFECAAACTLQLSCSDLAPGCPADIPKLSGGLAELVREWVTCSIDAVFYAWQLRSYTKSNKYTVGIIAYVLGAGIATSVFAPSFGSLAKKEQELEGGLAHAG